MERPLDAMTLLVTKTREIVLGAHDDVANRVAASHTPQLERTTVVGGPTRFGKRDVTAESCAKAATDAVAPGEHVQRVTLGLQPHVAI